MVPLSTSNKVLQVSVVLIMAISDRFHVLTLQVRDQARHVFFRVYRLGLLGEQLRKWLDELGQTFHRSTKHLRRYFALSEHRLFP
jgi:hypothetical protein